MISDNLIIEETGETVYPHKNPISRYRFVISNYNSDTNMVDNIRLERPDNSTLFAFWFRYFAYVECLFQLAFIINPIVAMTDSQSDQPFKDITTEKVGYIFGASCLLCILDTFMFTKFYRAMKMKRRNDAKIGGENNFFSKGIYIAKIPG